MSRLEQLQPGDVCAVRGPQKWYSLLIRFGAWLRGQPSTVSHVVVVTDVQTTLDGRRVVKGMEARPSRVGPVDMAVYDNPWLVHNSGQPKSVMQREAVVKAALAARGAAYDWMAIGSDALRCLGVPQPDVPNWGKRPPRRLVCSAFASWCYKLAELPEPSSEDRWCTPGEWALWCQQQLWAPRTVRR